MKSFQRFATHAALFTVLVSAVNAAEAAAISAKDLAAKLGELQQDGASYARIKLEVKPAGGAPKTNLQVQIKQQRTASGTDLVYQILWPKERIGEAVLLKQKGNGLSGSLLVDSKVQELSAGQMKESLFGSSLTYGDVLENFFAWENQKIVGTEMVGRVSCQVLESRPGKGQASSSSVVRSLIDTKRFVPLRIDKYSGSEAVKRIETTDVVSDDKNRSIPGMMTITDLKTGAVTNLEGAKLKHGVAYGQGDFTAAALTNISPPKSE